MLCASFCRWSFRAQQNLQTSFHRLPAKRRWCVSVLSESKTGTFCAFNSSVTFIGFLSARDRVFK